MFLLLLHRRSGGSPYSDRSMRAMHSDCLAPDILQVSLGALILGLWRDGCGHLRLVDDECGHEETYAKGLGHVTLSWPERPTNNLVKQSLFVSRSMRRYRESVGQWGQLVESGVGPSWGATVPHQIQQLSSVLSLHRCSFSIFRLKIRELGENHAPLDCSRN